MVGHRTEHCSLASCFAKRNHQARHYRPSIRVSDQNPGRR
jgi:hypothetical protein